MHRVKILLETIPEDVEIACQIPEISQGTIKCDLLADVKFKSTNEKHLIAVCRGHFDTGFSKSYEMVMERLKASIGYNNNKRTEQGVIPLEQPKPLARAG